MSLQQTDRQKGEWELCPSKTKFNLTWVDVQLSFLETRVNVKSSTANSWISEKSVRFVNVNFHLP
jgi:hypothetical protein